MGTSSTSRSLFKDVQEAIAVYSSDELDIDEGCGGGNNVELKDWGTEGKKRLDEAREALHYLCEPVPPRARWSNFSATSAAIRANHRRWPTPNRFGSATTSRRDVPAAYADLAAHLDEVGYTTAEADEIRREVDFHADTRNAVKRHSAKNSTSSRSKPICDTC